MTQLRGASSVSVGMGRRIGLCIALIAAALPAAVAADHRPGHQGGGGQNNISVDATTPIRWGGSTTVSGKLTGQGNSGVQVELEADPFPYADNDFAQVATAMTDANGDYRFTHQPQSNTRYRVTARTSPPVTSSIVTVVVRLKVTRRVSDSTPRAGSRVRFSGTVCPEHDGQTAAIQRRTSTGRFRTVRTTTLQDVPGSTCSSYARRVRVRRDGVYRVKATSGDGDHATGFSRRIRLNAH
jgi:hypothetical protein